MDNYAEEIKRRKAIVALLALVTEADDNIDPIEVKYVKGIAQQLGLTEEDINEVLSDPERYKLKPPSHEQDRMTILYFVLFTMSIDGKIHEEEERICFKLGLRLGFNEHLTRDLIYVMKKYLNKQLPNDALLNEIRKHMN